MCVIACMLAPGGGHAQGQPERARAEAPGCSAQRGIVILV